MIRPLRSAIVLCLLGIAVARPARGEFVLEFGQSNYSVAQGGTVDVDVFLEETGGTTRLQDDGLLSAAIRVLFNTPTRVDDPSQVTARIGNAGFDQVTTDPITPADSTTTGMANLVLDALLNPPVLADPSTPQRLFLGTFSFLAGATAGQVTNLLVTVNDPSQDNFAQGPLPGTIISNAQIADGTATITITGPPEPVVPEPSTLVLSALGGALLIGLRARRRPVLA